MNPLEVSSRIATSYTNYLRTAFSTQRGDWRAEFASSLERGMELVKGPYLQATPPFEPASSLRDLVREGVLSEGFRRLPAKAFPLDRRLYAHQDAAIRKALDGRNLLIATGTGSGKTEAILFPAIEMLLREQAAGTLSQPGVRALLLYPMNALANDQVRRFRSILAAFPEITFGRYVGDTREKPRDAQNVYDALFPGEPRLTNELLSRDEMREAPPHILITNFSMLEYMLLRPDDQPFFDGDKGSHWRVVSLDEAHVYDGADGAEIAMLMRRLRDRVVRSEKGRLRYIATSATLGSDADFPALVDFGRALFDEPFEQSDIVGPRRLPLARIPAEYELPANAYPALSAADDVAGIRRVLAGCCPEALAHVGDAADRGAALHAALGPDRRVARLQAALDGSMLPLGEAAQVAFGDPAARADLVCLVELGVAARADDSDASLLPARYHFWIRGLEGAFVCLHDRHPADAPRLTLQPADRCRACAVAGVDAALFELGSCRRCQVEYLIGVQRAGVLRRAPVGMSPQVYLLLGKPAEDDDEEDEDEDAGDDELAGDPVLLCAGCGAILDDPEQPCACTAPANRVAARQQPLPGDGEDKVLRRCGACHQSRSGADIVGRFLTDTSAPAAVISTALYQELPTAADPVVAEKLGGGRKLLAFADSRQEAAFFAPFLERTYDTQLRRSLILRAVRDLYEDSPVSFELLAGRLATIALEERVLEPAHQASEHRAEVRRWLMQELLSFDRRISLEGVGLVRTSLGVPKAVPAALAPLDLADDEARALLEMLLATLRADGALTFPRDVARTDPAFAPRNRDIAMRGANAIAAKAILAWAPSRGLNRRRNIVEKVASARGVAVDATSLLSEVWTELTNPGSPWDALLPQTLERGERGAVRRLAHDRHYFTPAEGAGERWRCGRCRQVSWANVAGVCPAYRCDGTLERMRDEEERNHYAVLYETLRALVMSAQEHTAQWAMERGSQIQNDFVKGDINVLSCSTTFELGVDVGEVEAVLLRNVPPTPANYVQRAGRAGRRQGSAAIVVTLAQRRNHDLSWFRDPAPMITGTVRPPVIIIDNPVIGRRHAHSTAVAAWLHVEQMFKAGPFALPDETGTSGSDRFVAWLRTKPRDLGDALERILPAAVAEAVGTGTWSWVGDRGVSRPDDPSTGWLSRAVEMTRDDFKQIETARAAAVEKEDYGRAKVLKGQRETLAEENLVSFLARRNVLPKYGFPVDVVELDLSLTGRDDAAGIKLDRDLRLAIAEYAPGGEVVAGKRVWRSIGLKRHAQQEWRLRDWAICGECGRYRDVPAESDLPEVCETCGSDERRAGGTWIQPIFGFIGAPSDTAIGETPVMRRASMQSWFGEYGREEARQTGTPAGIRPGTAETVLSPQGRIVVINQGSLKRGFRVCGFCGWAEPAPLQISKRAAAKKHNRPGRGAECSGTPHQRQLGHEFLTDVVEIRLGAVHEDPALRSALYAILEGAGAIGIKRDEVDGTLHRWRAGSSSALVIYDTVPGGAGHARRIRDELAAVVDAAIVRMERCDCGLETSCYGCLRSYGNQLWHDELVRSAAAEVLRPLRL